MELDHAEIIGESKQRGTILVSLGARVMTAAYLNHVANVAQQLHHSLTVCFLDRPETINQEFLWGRPPTEADEYVRSRCETLRRALQVLKPFNVSFATWTQYASEKTFSLYLDAVERTYEQSNEFQSHCRNQVFRNLQPILHQHGVNSKRHQLTATLAPYIIQEIALKLFLAGEHKSDTDFAPQPEMDLVEAIYNGKYPNLKALARQRMAYVVVQPSAEDQSA